MKVFCSKIGSKWKAIFDVENADPSGMSLIGNFNGWLPNLAKSSFTKGKRKLSIWLPEGLSQLTFKWFDMTHDCMCEVTDNGTLYAGMDRYLTSDEHGSVVVIPLNDLKS
jgi:hypothetical protein